VENSDLFKFHYVSTNVLKLW